MGKLTTRALRLAFIFALAFVSGHVIKTASDNPFLMVSLFIVWAMVFVDNILKD